MSPKRERADTWSILKAGAALSQRLDLELEGRQPVTNHFMGPPSST